MAEKNRMNEMSSAKVRKRTAGNWYDPYTAVVLCLIKFSNRIHSLYYLADHFQLTTVRFLSSHRPKKNQNGPRRGMLTKFKNGVPNIHDDVLAYARFQLIKLRS